MYHESLFGLDVCMNKCTMGIEACWKSESINTGIVQRYRSALTVTGTGSPLLWVMRVWLWLDDIIYSEYNYCFGSSSWNFWMKIDIWEDILSCGSRYFYKRYRILVSMLMNLVLLRPFDLKAILDLVLAWSRTHGRPLTKPMMTQFHYTLWGQKAAAVNFNWNNAYVLSMKTSKILSEIWFKMT